MLLLYFIATFRTTSRDSSLVAYQSHSLAACVHKFHLGFSGFHLPALDDAYVRHGIPGWDRRI